MRGISAKEKKELVALVKGQCCNYMGDVCILGECYCPQLGRISVYNQCVEAGDESATLLVCRWFADAVLPLNADLHAKFANTGKLRKCELCGKQFAAKTAAKKYCPDCATLMRKKRQRAYVAKKR